MLKYAAMSLLSKTLQTFLYKYLLDVDVEGVAMPSFMDVDGHSGWGVRLCNVRLREGVELMTLPGKRKVRIKRPKPPKEPPMASVSGVQEQAAKEASTMTGNGAETSVLNDAAAANIETATQSLDEANNDDLENETIRVRERRSMPVSPDYYASDDGESVVSDDGGGTRSRTSSVVEPRSWVCFSRGSNAVKDNAPVSFTPSDKSAKSLKEEEATQATQSSLSLAADGEADVSSQKAPAHTEPMFPNTGCDDEEEEEDEYIEVEKDMVLRLGNGGRIGVLDVRLVGKELHVSVEDAFLVVEACQKPDEPTDDADDGSTVGSEKDEGPKGKEPPGDKKKPASTKKADKDMSEGERVLDKSVIARALSAIPHLFLRDCRVRLVVREGDVGQEAEPDISDKDSILDIGIELLSVTSGEDFLAHVRADEEDAAANSTVNEEAYQSQASFATYDESSNNEFIVKRIRTGRGPEGGIWLNIFPPGKRNREKAHLKDDGESQSDEAPQWARERWMSDTEYCFFRCSGLDVRTRIFVGKQEETIDEYFFYDEFSVDSMLVGVDYVAPGPAPALPPLSEGVDAAALEGMQASGGVNCYETDENGIQSVKLDSIFHKVARDLVPTACRGDHLPCETCSACWTSDGKKAAKMTDHPLDRSTPLAGVVLNLSLNDPLEINTDRSSLEVIGQLVSLFLKKAEASSEVASEEPEEDLDAGTSTHGGRLCMPVPRRNSAKKSDISESFPTYMQPENIEILGLHLATIVIRIHAMRSDGSYDGALSFCYWETQTRCITMDIQKLSSEKNVQDVRIDVAEFSAIEYKGIKHSQLVTLGLPRPEMSSSSDSGSTSLKHLGSSSPKSPWPSTASALLGIPAPLETINYESRERHALQMRFVAVSGDSTDEQRSSMDMRIGVTSVDMPWKMKNDVYTVISESQKSVFGEPQADPERETNNQASTNRENVKEATPPKSSLMKCKIRFDGGRVNLNPLINLCLPPSTFFAEKSSTYGLFLETMLQRLEFAYGERVVVPKPRRGGLSLFASLPEGVRLRVLLFVNDLGPLETALGLKHEKNALLRYRSVNKGIVKVAKQSSKSRRKKGRSRMSSSQREEVLAELLSMDDASLQELWSLHRSNAQKPKDVSKRRSSN